MPEQMLLIIKPDVYENEEKREDALSKIENYLNANALRIIFQEERIPDKELVRCHYAASQTELLALGSRNRAKKALRGIKVLGTDLEIAQKIVEYNVEALAEKTVRVMIIRGEDAVNKIRKLIGPTEPAGAKITAPESLRAIFCTDSFEDAADRPLRNGFHGSDSVETALTEIILWTGIKF